MDQLQVSALPLGKRILNAVGVLIGALFLAFGASLVHIPFGILLAVPFLAAGPSFVAREMLSIVPVTFQIRRLVIIVGVVFMSLAAIAAAWSTADFFLLHGRGLAVYSVRTMILLILFTLIGPTLIAWGIYGPMRSVSHSIIWWLVAWAIAVLFPIAITTLIAIKLGVPFAA